MYGTGGQNVLKVEAAEDAAASFQLSRKDSNSVLRFPQFCRSIRFFFNRTDTTCDVSASVLLHDQPHIRITPGLLSAIFQVHKVY